uniref:Uncharacterized protein n=1 Tax=Timema tahoe TaxID=61484 RepID=A0A7R9NYA2_9NEOP|nr:unnamed protein product [Timema tahoe]
MGIPTKLPDSSQSSTESASPRSAEDTTTSIKSRVQSFYDEPGECHRRPKALFGLSEMCKQWSARGSHPRVSRHIER